MARMFLDIGEEPSMSKASGQVRGDADVVSEHFMVECKYRSVEGFGISRKDFQKACNQADKYGKDLVFAVRNHHGETVVTMNAKTWAKWMRTALERTGV